MKKLMITTMLSLGLVLGFAGCGEKDNNEDVSNNGTEQNQDANNETSDDANKGELKVGVYTGTASYSQEGFSMTWNMVLDFNEDNTFVLSNDAGEEKGAGTYEVTDSCYTMNYSDERTCTFVVQEDGSLKMTSELPYGKATIGLDEVGGIVLNYHGDTYEFADADVDASAGATSEASDASVAEGTYTASYTKESQMAGTVVYNYTAEVGADGTFSYAVTFDMKGTMYDGSSATGTYVIEDGKFVFTDSEGTVIEGTVTEENTFVISLKASQMASDPYEVTFVKAE